MRILDSRLAATSTLALSLLTLAGMASAATGDWAQWRGPNHDGISTETGLLKSWPAGGPPLVWKATGLGDGYSTVAVVGDRVYTSGDKGEANFVLALNRADGKPAWSAKLGKSGAPGNPKFEGPRGTPSVEGDMVVAVGQFGELAAFESATGKEVWRKDYLNDFGGKIPQWGFAESPLIDGEKVVVTPGGDEGAIVALNLKTGALIWRSKDFKDSPHYSSIIVVEIAGVRQYIQLTEASVAGVAAADGKLLWRAPRKGRVAVIPTPVYGDSCVYVASGYGVGCNLFRVADTGSGFNAEQAYANTTMVNHHGGVIKVGDFVYGYSDGKGWTCQNFKTGEAKWQSKDLGKGAIACADGHFYLRQEDAPGTVALIEASSEGYKETGRFDPPDRSSKKSWAHPVITGGKLYLRDQDVLLCYDVKTK